MAAQFFSKNNTLLWPNERQLAVPRVRSQVSGRDWRAEDMQARWALRKERERKPKSSAVGFKLTSEVVKDVELSEDGADRHIEKSQKN
ncbi:hypothetical protein N7450_005181 [Penicillium hetheringtonii]|uniref:Uncharacterized protein n=1 Tax=Penicillium hetheringtonii TaxID=911720 RepID=A0AAD6GX03_9EURO|nr:hypothetical protein N7450_005181 [Penicillium hetheringtonii]